MKIQHEYKGRTNYQQHGPSMFCINRTLIQKRLLVKFSCELPTLYLLKRFTHCVVIGLCDQWLPQQLQVYIVVHTVLYLYALSIDHSSYPFSSLCLSCNLNQAQDHNRNLLKGNNTHEIIVVGRGKRVQLSHPKPSKMRMSMQDKKFGM